jgi:hypothetical protein
MATFWGHNAIAPGESVGWFFRRASEFSTLPIFQIIQVGEYPVGQGNWALTSGGYPYWDVLGISTIWSQATSADSMNYYMVVQNNGTSPAAYFFQEADL